MFHVVLFNPEIPANTGNIIRLCANTDTALHLIHPLGFVLEDARLRRAGLDYHEYARLSEHGGLGQFMASVGPRRLYACSTRGRTGYATIRYEPGDAFLFGPETRGLPAEVLAGFAPDRVLRVPMTPHSRSLNLSNAVAVVIYEAWRQQGFAFEQADRRREP
jgi:tRNA (cytidine/uridine-2'-O-)-methyltransferase